MNEFVARNGIIALNDSQITGSLRLSNGSYSGSGAELYDIPASGINGLNSGSNATQSFSSPSSTWAFNHNLGNSNVIIQTYDLGNNQIIPQNIQLFNANSAVITFPTLETGYAIATLGGSTINNIVVNVSGSSGSFATTGSNTFIGNQLITGTLQVTSGNIIGTLTGNADTATTASFASTASFVRNAQTASFVVTAQTASFVQTAQTASYVLNAVSASFVTTAATASFANTLYQADGTLAGARTVTLGNNPLTFVGLTNTNRFFANGNVGIGTTVDGGFNLNVSGSAFINGLLTAPSMSAANQIAISTTTLSGGGGQVSITAPNLVTTPSLSAGLSLLNSTAATSGVPVQISPALILRSNKFSSTAQYSDIILYNRGINGATSQPQFVIGSSANGGAVSDLFVIGPLNIVYGGSGTVFFSSARVQCVSFSSGNSIVVGGGAGALIATSAVLEARSTTGGFLPPRMTTTQRQAISAPAVALQVYDTDLDRISYNSSTGYQSVANLNDVTASVTTNPAINLFNYYNFY
jgi:hypothetical protein